MRRDDRKGPGDRIRIRLKAFDHRVLDQSAVRIVDTDNHREFILVAESEAEVEKSFLELAERWGLQLE